MSSGNETWKRAFEIWLTIREMPQEEWPTLIDSQCDDDWKLRDALLSMADGQRAADALKRDRETVEFQPMLLEPGSSIGPYRVLTALGEGGMGQVYLALRMEEPDYRVDAVKIIPKELVTEDGIARIGRESSRLKVLGRHPYFPEYRDHHVAIQGTSYLAMEYVHGIAIDDYCEKHSLSLEDRLKLFVEVCRGVGFAHGENDPNREIKILHRDLTPANILVDEQGKPRILDLGISKALTEGGGSKTLTAALEHPHYTPNYASPEQIEGSWLTVPSDVYSLGAVLYKLITGCVPIDMSKVADNYNALLARVNRVEPPKASKVAPKKWKRRVKGDLDVILIKALAKESGNRYQSASDFADDIERLLNGEEIKARKPTLGYRAERTIRQYRIAITVSAILLAASAVFSFFSYRQYRATKLAQGQTEVALDRAKSVTDFIIGIFSNASPDQTLGEEVSVPELIENSRNQLQLKLSESPIERAALTHALGRLYMELGSYPESEEMFETALDLQVENLGADHIEVAETRYYYGFQLARFGKLDEAEEQLRKAVQLWEMNDAPKEKIAATCAILAKVLQLKNQNDEAMEFGQRALALYDESIGSESVEYASALDTVATVHQQSGEYDEAEPLFRRAVEIGTRVLDPRHPDLANLQSNLGLLLYYTSQYREAKQLLIEAVEIKRQVFGPSHPSTIGTLNNLGLVYGALEEWEAGEATMKEVLELQKAAVGRDHPHFAFTLNSLAVQYRNQDRNSEAEPLLREAIETKKRHLGPDHPSVAASINSLAALLSDTDRFDAAVPLFEEALSIYKAAHGDTHPNYLKVLHNFSQSYREHGRLEEARSSAQEVLAKTEGSLGREHAQYGAAAQNLGEIALAQEQLAEAEEYFLASLACREVVYGEMHPQVLKPLKRLEELMNLMNRPDRAREYRERIEQVTYEKKES